MKVPFPNLLWLVKLEAAAGLMLEDMSVLLAGRIYQLIETVGKTDLNSELGILGRV